ncbi:MAG: aldo/keto reductase family oxidoreductase [Rectinemataceae bacterium]
MEMIKLANTDIEVSRLCAGCMGLGGGWERNTVIDSGHLAQARDFISANLDLGINFFDHADIYARGRAEEVFGRVLKERPSLRARIVLQSKCGVRWADDPPGAPQRFDFSAGHIIASVDASLKRLGTDYLDILLLHRPDVLCDGEEVASAFSSLKSEGKVRYFGVSNQNRSWIEYLQSFLPNPLVVNQVQMSLLHHAFVEVAVSFNQEASGYPDGWEGLIEYCRLKGVCLQAWSPLDKGRLVGAKDAGADLSANKAATLVSKMAIERNVKPEAIALAWLLRHPAKIVPVLGTTRPDRIAACARAIDVNLSYEDWYSLFEAARGKAMP